MGMKRGEIRWADLPAPRGSESGFRRPVLVVQANEFNESTIGTILVTVITSNMRLASAPGNLRLTPRVSHLSRESVVNVSQVFALDRAYIGDLVGRLPERQMLAVDEGLRLVFSLG